MITSQRGVFAVPLKALKDFPPEKLSLLGFPFVIFMEFPKEWPEASVVSFFSAGAYVCCDDNTVILCLFEIYLMMV